jgi:hypothetical protein
VHSLHARGIRGHDSREVAADTLGTARFDDGTPDNVKLIAAGPVAAWMWFCGVLYCRKALTDGFIPKAVVPSLVRDLKQPFKHAARLVEVRLWHDALGGYEVHDYLDWNPTKAAMNAYRKHDRERKQKKHGIQSEVSSGIQTESVRNPADVADERARAGVASRAKSESESESERFVGSGSSEGSLRETTAPLPPTVARLGAGMRPGGLVGDHRRCAPQASEACARGLCVPAFLVSQWLTQMDADVLPDVAAADVKRFVRETLDGLPPGPVGDDPLKFWRDAWRVAHGSRTGRSEPTKAERSADAFDRVGERLEQVHESRGAQASEGRVEVVGRGASHRRG